MGAVTAYTLHRIEMDLCLIAKVAAEKGRSQEFQNELSAMLSGLVDEFGIDYDVLETEVKRMALGPHQ